MGWMGTQTDSPNHILVTEEIEYGGGHTVVGRSGKYYAVRNNNTGSVYGLVALVRSKDGWKYTKLVDEDMGPCEVRCPAKILNMLSPTAEKYAVAWRETCRANIIKQKATPKVTEGSIIKLVEPVTFSDGVTESTFEFVERYTFRRNTDKRLVRLRKAWKTQLEWNRVSDG